jgi:hypothetical protein
MTQEYEPITRGAKVKVFKRITNKAMNASGAMIEAPGSNEYKIPRMGPSKENRGPSGRKARPYAQMRRAMAANAPKRPR